MDYSKHTMIELTIIKEHAEARESHWKSCCDGSYEMALYHCEHRPVTEEINKRITEYETNYSRKPTQHKEE